MSARAGLAVLALAMACGARSSLVVPLGVREGAGDDGNDADGADGASSGAASGERDGDHGSGSSGGGKTAGVTSGRASVGTVGPSSGGGEDSGGGSSSGGGNATGCGGGGALPPSCAPGGPGMTNCGACLESCCKSLEVAGGTYDRTYTNDGQGPMNAADPAQVHGLRVDKYLVTVGRFRQFVRAWDGGRGYDPANGAGLHAYLNGGQGLEVAGSPGTYETGWNTEEDDAWLSPSDANLTECDGATWTPSPGANENLPMTCMDWWEAYAFCIWDDAFLPSEAEWEYASAGGDEQRAYPWGDTSPGTGNQYAVFGYGSGMDCYYPDGGACTGTRNIAPVGAAPLGQGRYGQLDLAGDVGEWTLDWFAPYVDPCVDCAALSAASLRVIRGGAYDQSATFIAPWSRSGRYPSGRNGDVGLRCARSP